MSGSHELTRRDFIKLTTGIVGGAIGGVFGLSAITKYLEAGAALSGYKYHETHLKEANFDPHALQVYLPFNLQTGILTDELGQVRRVESLGPAVEHLHDNDYSVEVPWQGDSPTGVCIFKTPQGGETVKPLFAKEHVKFMPSNDKPQESTGPVDIEGLTAEFDMATGYVFIKDSKGFLVKIGRPPASIQDEQEQEIAVSISPSWMGGRGRKPGVPIGQCKITTASGDSMHNVNDAQAMKFIELFWV